MPSSLVVLRKPKEALLLLLLRIGWKSLVCWASGAPCSPPCLRGMVGLQCPAEREPLAGGATGDNTGAAAGGIEYRGCRIPGTVAGSTGAATNGHASSSAPAAAAPGPAGLGWEGGQAGAAAAGSGGSQLAAQNGAANRPTAVRPAGAAGVTQRQKQPS